MKAWALRGMERLKNQPVVLRLLSCLRGMPAVVDNAAERVDRFPPVTATYSAASRLWNAIAGGCAWLFNLAPLRLPVRLLCGTAKGFTAYDLFAIAIIFTISDHALEAHETFSYWLSQNDAVKDAFAFGVWQRVPGRIVLPIFMVSVGYNAGRRVDKRLLAGAIAVEVAHWLAMKQWPVAVSSFPFSILATIIAARFVLEPLMEIALKRWASFWGITLLLALAAPFTSQFLEYGTGGLVMAMAGWLSRNRGRFPSGIVSVKAYFVLSFALYIVMDQSLYHFPPDVLLAWMAGTAYVFVLLYHFKDLVANSLHRKASGLITRISRFTGRNSLELYVLHMLVYYAIYAYAVHALFPAPAAQSY